MPIAGQAILCWSQVWLYYQFFIVVQVEMLMEQPLDLILQYYFSLRWLTFSVSGL